MDLILALGNGPVHLLERSNRPSDVEVLRVGLEDESTLVVCLGPDRESERAQLGHGGSQSAVNSLLIERCPELITVGRADDGL